MKIKISKALQKKFLILGCLVVFTYFLSLGNQYVWDDESQILDNKMIQNVSNILGFFVSGIVYIPGQALSGGFYRPILSTVYALIYTISSKPFVFRFFQIVFHLINTLLVYLVLYKLFSLKYDNDTSEKGALFCSIIFAIHPAVSEAVLFMAAIGEPLYTLFLLAGIYMLVTFPFKPSFKYQFSYFLIFLLGLLTKESAVVFLPISFAYYFLFKKNKINKLTFIIPVVSFLTYFTMRFLSIGFLKNSLDFPAPIAKATLIERILTIPKEIIFYFQVFLWPFNLSISRHFVVTTMSDIGFAVPLVILILLLLTVVIFYYRKKSELFLFFCLSFFISLGPIVNLIPLSSTVAERWLYFPLIFLTALIALVYFETKTLKKIPFLRYILIIYITIMSFTTLLRSLNWKNGYLLYSHDIKNNPDSFDLVNNLGVEVFRKGEINASSQYFQKSIDLNPIWWVAYNNLGVVYERNNDATSASKLYLKSIETGRYFLAYENYISILIRNRKYKEAGEVLKNTVRYFPTYPKMHVLYAISLYMERNKDEALKEIKTAYTLEPTRENLYLLQTISQNREIQL